VRKFLIHEIARLRYSASRVAALVRSSQAFVRVGRGDGLPHHGGVRLKRPR
jgi:hypothetical protein